MLSRRQFLHSAVVTGSSLAVGSASLAGSSEAATPGNPLVPLYRALNGTPAENLTKVVELMGGIEAVVGPDDAVLLKPNVQWWNQGAPNLAALGAFIDLVMERPGGFKGEVVIAENCHRGKTPWMSINWGWAHQFERNADIPQVTNVNDLSVRLKKRYGARFSTVHLIDVSAGAKRVASPSDGEGYVYCDGTRGVPLLECSNGLTGLGARATIMTYPVFRTERGTIIDFRNGIWKGGAYTGQPLRFVNFSAVNHHSTYCGMTSSVKNYMGITDLSGGPDPMTGGRLTGEYYNFHSFPFDKWSPGPTPGMLGKEIGTFMRTVRKADLNIATAEWVGLSSRVDGPVARTRAVIACADPVALDYHVAKYVLYPNSSIAVHNPDDGAGPLRDYLLACAKECGAVLGHLKSGVHSYDLSKKRLQGDSELLVRGEAIWNWEPKPLLKYLYLRFLA